MSHNEYNAQVQAYLSLKLRLLTDPVGRLGRPLTERETCFLSGTYLKFYQHLTRQVIGTDNRFEAPVSFSILKDQVIWDINKTVTVLKQYKRIILFANSDAADPTSICYAKDDLVIVFNEFNKQWLTSISCDLCFVERQCGIYDKTFSHHIQDIQQKKTYRIILSDIFRHSFNLQPDMLSRSLAFFSSDYINYSVDKRTVASSGYLILYFLNYLRLTYQLEAEIMAVGFQFAGADVHDWQYEAMMVKHFPFTFC